MEEGGLAPALASSLRRREESQSRFLNTTSLDSAARTSADNAPLTARGATHSAADFDASVTRALVLALAETDPEVTTSALQVSSPTTYR